MSALVALSFVFDMEKRMRAITLHDYDRLNGNTWWRGVAKEMALTSKAERIAWLLDTAGIDYVDRLGGMVTFEDLVSQAHEIDYKAATAGLRLNRYQMSDVENGMPGGEALRLAAHWSRGIGAYGAYWPQKQVAAAVNGGEAATSLAYDAQIFFSAAHPNHPFDTSLGTYANVLTGAPSGAFPGAVPIDTSVTADVALTNLHKAVAYVKSLKMPNGVDPRMLRVTGIMHPPALTKRVTEVTDSKFIATAAASGGGSADVAAVISKLGLGNVIECDELGAGFPNGSDTSYYLMVEQITSDELGAIIYANREPFSVVYHDGMSEAELNRGNELEWVCRGANKVHYGHPFLLFKCKST